MTLTRPPSGDVGTIAPPVTSADLVAYMGGSSAVSSAMDRIVTTAISLVEGTCGPIAAGQRDYLAAQTAAGALVLPVVSSVITSIDAVTAPDGTDGIAGLMPGDVDWGGGVVWPSTTADGTWSVRATTARDAGDVAALTEATLMIAKHLWEARRGGQARPTTGLDGNAIVQVPVRAQMILDNYGPPGFA